jgi:hypothetical protein
MLTYSQINDYFFRKDFLGASAALAAEGARLGQVSASHPVLALLNSVRSAQFAVDMESLKFGHYERAQEDLADIKQEAERSRVILNDAAAALRAMLSLPQKQRLKEDFSLNGSQVNALTYGAHRDATFGCNQASASLLENIAALGWSEGLKVMHEFFPKQASVPRFHRLLAALDSAAINNQSKAVEDILGWTESRELKAAVSGDVPTRVVNLVQRLLQMKDVDGSFISRAMTFFQPKAIGPALLGGYAAPNVPKNVLAWFSLSPSAWAPLHRAFEKNHLDSFNLAHAQGKVRSVVVPSAWPALLSAVLAAPWLRQGSHLITP